MGSEENSDQLVDMVASSSEETLRELKTRNIGITITEVTIMFLILIISLSGNLISCKIIYKNHKLRTMHNLFIINLIITDILFSLIPMPSTVVVLIIGEWSLGDTFCTMAGFVQTVLSISFVLTLSLLTVNRYFLYVHPRYYKLIFSPRYMALMVICVWILALICSSPPLMGWGAYIFLPGNAICFVYFGSSMSYATFLMIILGPMVTVFIGVFVKFYIVTKRSQVNDVSVGNEIHRLQVQAEGKNAVKSLVALNAVVYLSWLPALVLYILVYLNVPKIPRSFSLICTLLGYSSCSLKPLVYSVLNKEFREDFLRHVKCNCLQNQSENFAENANADEMIDVTPGNNLSTVSGVNSNSTSDWIQLYRNNINDSDNQVGRNVNTETVSGANSNSTTNDCNQSHKNNVHATDEQVGFNVPIETVPGENSNTTNDSIQLHGKTINESDEIVGSTLTIEQYSRMDTNYTC